MINALPVASSRADSNGSRRPLVLGARVKARVEADGPALRIRAAGRAEARYPLARLSRIVASLRVEWSASALRACLETGIPIVIVGEDGAALGALHPSRPVAAAFSARMEELLDRPDGLEIYANWLRATRMRVLANWRAERELAGAAVGSGEFAELVRRHVYGGETESAFRGTTGLWRGAICALAAEAIQRAGLQPVYWGEAAEPLDLRRDLAQVLELRLRLEVRQGMEGGLDGEPAVLRVFHAKAGVLQAEAQRLIGSLACRINRALAEWR